MVTICNLLCLLVINKVNAEASRKGHKSFLLLLLFLLRSPPLAFLLWNASTLSSLHSIVHACPLSHACVAPQWSLVHPLHIWQQPLLHLITLMQHLTSLRASLWAAQDLWLPHWLLVGNWQEVTKRSSLNALQFSLYDSNRDCQNFCC